jgi:phosphoesterase RecJ-like protein
MISGGRVKVPADLISFLKKEDHFFLATHINPEADALGSCLALSMALDTLGKETIVYDRDSVPEFCKFLPHHERVVHSTSNITHADMNLILLDCNTPERAGIGGLNFKNAAVIDHHRTEKDFGDIRWIVPGAAATGMMIFYLLKELKVKLTQEMAVNLYAAIAIDTGTFRFGNTTPDVLRVAAELADAGASPAFISNSLYEAWTEKRFRLLIMMLNTLEIRDGIAFVHVTREMFDKTGTGPEDTENFVGFPRMIKNIVMSAFFRETDDNEWKVSLRSKGDTDVSKIAYSFGGGGHKNAAGYEIKEDFESAKKYLLNRSEKFGVTSIRHSFQGS